MINRDTLPLLSFIIGLGVSVMLFHKPFEYKKKLSLPLEEIHDHLVQVDGKCYKYVAEDSQCEILSSK